MKPTAIATEPLQVRLWAHAAEKRGPAIAVGAERSRQNRDYRIGRKVQRGSAPDAGLSDGVKIAADEQRNLPA